MGTTDSQKYVMSISIVVGVAVLLRLMVGLHSYSGRGSPPKYGDYEAQRHWMEVTLHTPPSEWYVNTTRNDLAYWGLDYPPLTAYQSWLHGKFVEAFEWEAVALFTSRGYETPSSKLLLRGTVLLSDLAVFFPSAIWFVESFYRGRPLLHRAAALAFLLWNPALILIDHGHFQYNCISLGFSLAAAAAILQGWAVVGSVLFCLALNHKQMSMYYAPAFFSHLLGRCLHSARPLREVSKLGLAVVLTFAVLWAPFLTSKEAALQVLSRLAPVSRGLYEDYVANWWCATSPFIKWKRLFSIPALVRLCLGATLGALVPTMLQQIRRPSPTGLLLAMLNSAWAFFLFSFQVHEKSVLLPLLPATMLAIEEPLLVRWMAPLACFSMFPLLQRDELVVAYLGLLLFTFALIVQDVPPTKKLPQGFTWESLLGSWAVGITSFIGGVLLHVAAVMVKPPEKFPFLYPALMTTYAACHFLCLWRYTNHKQWVPRQQRPVGKKL